VKDVKCLNESLAMAGAAMMERCFCNGTNGCNEPQTNQDKTLAGLK
jgi:hypothetical protein